VENYFRVFCRSFFRAAFKVVSKFLAWKHFTEKCLTGFQVIAAEGEMTASRSLKEAADVMSETPSAMQLRYLQTLNTISAEKNSTIIFPIPVDFMSTLFKK